MRQRVARWAIAAVVAAGVAVAGTATTSSAATNCSARSTKAAFSKWGDTNSYFLVDGGSFETATNWSTSLVSRLVGNEPWKVNASSDAWALQINALGKAQSPSFCVASAEDSMRFFVKKPGIIGSRLHVHINVTSGVNVATNDYDVDGSGFGWVPADRIMLPDIRDASGQQWVTISFTAAGLPAIWLVDDVMVDPWVAR